MTAKASKRRGPRKATAGHLENAGLYYLQRFATSAANLRRVLMRKVLRSAHFHGTDPDAGAAVVDDLIGRYIASGLLDDGAYARARAESLHRRGNSARTIRAKLRQKGVADDAIDGALAALAGGAGAAETELEAARAYARRRRLGPYASGGGRAGGRERHLAALARAGFSYDVALRVIDAPGDDDRDAPGDIVGDTPGDIVGDGTGDGTGDGDGNGPGGD